MNHVLIALFLVVAGTAIPPAPEATMDQVAWARVVPLVSRLSSADLKERERATQGLLALGPPAVEGLLFVAERSPEIRDRIVDLLPRFGPTAIRQFAATSYRYGSSPSSSLGPTAQAAVVAMGAEALPALEGMLQFGDASFAVGVLRRMPWDLSLPVLLRSARHANPDTRKWVVTVVGQINRPEAVDALLVATRDSDLGVRSKAWEGLGRTKDRRAIPILRQQMRSNAWETLLVAPSDIYASDLLFEFASAARNPRAIRSGARKTTEERDRIRGKAASTLMGAGDAASRGIGARYRLPAVLWTLQWRLVILWYGLLVLASAAVIIVPVGFAGGGDLLKRGHLIAISALALFGFWWGCFATGVSGDVEALILFVAVPFAVALSAVTGPQPGLAWRLFPPLLWALLAVVVSVFGSLFVMFFVLSFKIDVPMWLFVDPETAAVGALVIVVLLVVRRIAKDNWENPRYGGSPAFRRTCLLGTAAFYACYFLGQTVLWGWSLEWLRLWSPVDIA